MWVKCWCDRPSYLSVSICRPQWQVRGCRSYHALLMRRLQVIPSQVPQPTQSVGESNQVKPYFNYEENFFEDGHGSHCVVSSLPVRFTFLGARNGWKGKGGLMNLEPFSFPLLKSSRQLWHLRITSFPPRYIFIQFQEQHNFTSELCEQLTI